MARIAVRVSGGSVCQAPNTLASSGSIGGKSSPTAAHSAALPKTESRNVLPAGSLRESVRFPSTPARGFRTLVHPPATPCTTGGCFISGKSVCDPVRDKTGNHVLVARLSTLVDRRGTDPRALCLTGLRVEPGPRSDRGCRLAGSTPRGTQAPGSIDWIPLESSGSICGAHHATLTAYPPCG